MFGDVPKLFIRAKPAAITHDPLPYPRSERLLLQTRRFATVAPPARSFGFTVRVSSRRPSPTRNRTGVVGGDLRRAIRVQYTNTYTNVRDRRSGERINNERTCNSILSTACLMAATFCKLSDFKSTVSRATEHYGFPTVTLKVSTVTNAKFAYDRVALDVINTIVLFRKTYDGIYNVVRTAEHGLRETCIEYSTKIIT